MKRISTISTTSLLFSIITVSFSGSVCAQDLIPTPNLTTTATPDVSIETPVVETATPTPTATPSALVLVTEGIAGDIDIHDRDPILTFSADQQSDGVHILADGAIKNDDYKKYPLKFEFYVNGELFTSQIRTPELPRSIGIIVPTSTASIPFSYSIKLTLITPNREFTTMAQAAAE